MAQRLVKRFYATMSAAKYRRITRTLRRAYEALYEAKEHAEYFDAEVIWAARSALLRVPGVLRVQVCPACSPSGYNDGNGDGFTAYSCNHPGVASYRLQDEVL